MNKPREEEKEMNSKEICSKKCDLINGIYIGQKNESWYCKTHKRTYWPNGVPRVYTQQELDQALQAERDRVLGVAEKYLDPLYFRTLDCTNLDVEPPTTEQGISWEESKKIFIKKLKAEVENLV